MRWRVAALGLLGLFLAAMLVARCGGDPGPFQETIDALSLPQTWETAKTTVKGGALGCIAIDDFYCPSVRRYYLAAGTPPGVFQDARRAILALGFGDLFESAPECDRNTNGAICLLSARLGKVRIEVNIYPPGQDLDSLGISDPARPGVRITVY
jgi:hypothetical protein